MIGSLSRFQPLPVSQLLTPCLVVLPAVIEQNLRGMISIAGSPDHLRPHVKTHKCRQIVEMAVSMGIGKHKCATLAEAEMLAGLASDVLLAYPQVGPAVKKLGDLVCQFPKCQWSTVVDSRDQVDWLAAEFAARKIPISVFIDIDTGMHRTGIEPGHQAAQLAAQIHGHPSLRLAGLHVYDGQNHQTDCRERAVAVEAGLKSIDDLLADLKKQHLPVPRLVCGGTPSFPIFATLRHNRFGNVDLPEIELSPGTTVLSDFNYNRDFSDIVGIEPAAMMLTRVVSKPGRDLVTVDLGYKAISADQPAGSRCHFLDLPDAEEIRHSEEHLVVRTASASKLKLGQLLRVLPAHICPTVALHDHMMVLDSPCLSDPSISQEHALVIDQWPVIRHRIYH